MVMTIDIPDKAIKLAAEQGVPVEQFVSQELERIWEEPIPEGFVRLGTSTKTLAEATASILDIQKRNTLGGLKIKDLIEEGRRL